MSGDYYKVLHYPAKPCVATGCDYIGRPYEVVDVEQLPDGRWRVHLQHANPALREIA